MKETHPNTANEMRRLSSRGCWAKRAALIMGSVVLSLAAAEIGLRVVGFSYPVRFARDENRGYSYRPGLQWVHSTEGRAKVRINAHGFRDSEHPCRKPANTVRIAVLGDSYVDALQVAQNRRFTEVLEQELHANDAFSGQRVEVLNFGTAGYGTAQEFMTLRNGVWQFQPDIVVLAFLTGNDIRNNSEALEGDPVRPYFVYRDDELTLDASFRNDGHEWKKQIGLTVARWSRISQLVYRLHHGLKQRGVAARMASSSPLHAQLFELGLAQPGMDLPVYSEPDDERWAEAWRVTEGLLGAIKQEVEAHDARLFVVTLSNAIQVHPDPEARRRFMDLVGIDDLFYPDARIASAGDRLGISVLNLAPRLQDYAVQHQTHLHGFPNTRPNSGHWNEQGHRVAGRLIAEWLLSAQASSRLTKATPIPGWHALNEARNERSEGHGRVR